MRIRYIIRRILYLIPLFLGILIIVFVAIRAAGDPIDLMLHRLPGLTEEDKNNIARYYGLDQPLHVQFLSFLSRLIQGDLGKSYHVRAGVDVVTIIGESIGPTILLQTLSLTLALMIAIPVGIISAKKKYSKLDMTLTTTSLLGSCIPIFYVGIIAILIFGYYLMWFPAGGFITDPRPTNPYFGGHPILDILWHLTLPTATLTFAILSPLVLLIRSSMLEVLKQDYILAARASGLSERVVIYKHALRNAVIPIVTWVGIYFGSMVAGAPITETVFNWPGIGRLFIRAMERFDYQLLMGIVVITAVMTLVSSLITDITYGYIDPRISVE